MSAVAIACIGGGNMGFALMKGIAGICGELKIGFADADGEKAKAAADAIGAAVYGSNAEAAARADFIFLAVKPQVLEGVLAEIAPAVQERRAAGNHYILTTICYSLLLSLHITVALSCICSRRSVSKCYTHTADVSGKPFPKF